MRIAIASGKGGTGKTTVAVSLALSLAQDHRVRYFDCDVEAPNGHLFLTPSMDSTIPAVISIPRILKEACTACGRCVKVCQFHALAQIGKNILVFPQLCHGCGSCTWNCPEGAIVEIPNQIGVLEGGSAREGVQYFRGVLTISEPMPTPVIRQLKKWPAPVANSIDLFDAPPGASCSVVETLRGADYVILVTEATPFGLHDLKQMTGIIREMKIPAGVVINRASPHENLIDNWCAEEKLNVILRIPFEREIAAAIAAGHTLVELHPHYEDLFQELFSIINKEVR